MARNPGAPSVVRGRSARRSSPAPTAAPPAAAKTAESETPRRRTGPAQFLREVRAEARKITWTSRKETWITSVMVVIMVVTTALFFLVVDQLLGQGMQLLLKLAV